MNRTNISSVAAGMLGGVLMALVMLYMMIHMSFRLEGFSAVIAVILSAALPLCFGFVKRLNLSASLFETAAVISSFLITLLYGTVAGNPADLAAENTLLQEVLPMSAILHGCALAAVVFWNSIPGRE